MSRIGSFNLDFVFRLPTSSTSMERNNFSMSKLIDFPNRRGAVTRNEFLPDPSSTSAISIVLSTKETASSTSLNELVDSGICYDQNNSLDD